jgi:hypothetical protein
MIEMLKEHTSCQLCLLKTPLEKTEKNSFNISFFFIIHLIVELEVFFALIPCINNNILYF